MVRSWVVLANSARFAHRLPPVRVFGQARDTASLFGTVTDAQAAVVPGARVTVTNRATGLSRTVTTDAAGAFTLPLLPVGYLQLDGRTSGIPQV